MIKVEIQQSNENCLVYYDLQIDEWHCSGDALDVISALKMIEHYLTVDDE